MPYLYVFADKGLPGSTKIGTSSTLTNRYKQARCHTPRGIRAAAFFEFGSTQEANAAESAAHRYFASSKRGGDTKEWFDIGPDAAIQELRRASVLEQVRSYSQVTPSLSPQHRLYDDWRECTPAYMRYKWRLFLFEEQSPLKFLKLSYGALYATAYRYVFTYNPYPVRLVAGFEDRGTPEKVGEGNAQSNRRMAEVWTNVQRDFGNPHGEEVGWLRQGVRAADVAQRLVGGGFHAFDLSRPKPRGAPPKDASVASIEDGAVPPLHRVSPSVEVYGR